MTLDKMLYQQAYRSYRQWSEAEANARAHATRVCLQPTKRGVAT
jgi:hypothetical protein